MLEKYVDREYFKWGKNDTGTRIGKKCYKMSKCGSVRPVRIFLLAPRGIKQTDESTMKMNESACSRRRRITQ